jgi:hypothetical protein
VPNISGLPELDTAIGLAFLFFLLAVAVSAINEMIASVLGWRAKTLEDGIRRLLQDPDIKKGVGNWARGLVGLLPKSVTKKQDALKQLQAIQQGTSNDKLGDLTTTLFEDWRIQALVRDPNAKSRRRRRPSYLPPAALSRALLDQLAALGGGTPATATTAPATTTTGSTGATPDAGTGQGTGTTKDDKTLWQEADEKLFAQIQKGIDEINGGSPALSAALAKAVREPEARLETFRKAIEGYFDDTMARASGWYKRKVQFVVLILGVLLAIGLNVNTVEVASRLWKEPALRSAVASQATAAVTNAKKETTTPTPQQVADKIDAVKQLNLPVGWGKVNTPTGFNGWAGAIAGWLITIAAISLGAPFWFDLLSRLARLRGSGPPDASRPLSDKGPAAT